MKRVKRILITFALSTSLVLYSPSTTVLNTNVITVQAKSKTVYITETGTKYHKKKCGNGDYSKTTLAKAKKAGLEPCKKCYGK